MADKKTNTRQVCKKYPPLASDQAWGAVSQGITIFYNQKGRTL